MTAKEWADQAFQAMEKATGANIYRHTRAIDKLTEYFEQAMQESRMHVYSVAMRDLDEEVH